MDFESMETKQRLLELRQRWDVLYQAAMEQEIKTEVGLKPLHEFRLLSREFEEWLETSEEHLALQMIGVGSTLELSQQVEACRVNPHQKILKFI